MNKNELATASFHGFCFSMGSASGLTSIPREHCVITITEIQVPHRGQSLGSGLRNHMYSILFSSKYTLHCLGAFLDILVV